MCLISTLSSSLTPIFVLESDLPASQCGTASSLLWEQEISYKSWPLAPGWFLPCEKMRNYNSIITIIHSLSTLQAGQVLFSRCLAWCPSEGQLNTFHVNINWRFSASQCLSVSAELSVIGTNLYLELTDWMWDGCQEEINILLSGNI